MRFEVSLYAYHREKHGGIISVESEPTVPALLAALSDQGVVVTHSRLAVDEEFSQGSEVLTERSRLALIPPVSGG